MKIYKSLQSCRGHNNFIKTTGLPHCDFCVPERFILEFDESQHFTELRAIALENYPADLNLNFDKSVWVERCRKLNRKDNNPVYRDEQRAWYDTVRDFSSSITGLPVIRILPGEMTWCQLNENNPAHLNKIKIFLEGKIQSKQKTDYI